MSSLTPDHDFCFRLDCDQRPDGTELIVQYLFCNCNGQPDTATLALPFCGLNCLLTFAIGKGAQDILEQVLSTHAHRHTSHKPKGQLIPVIERAENAPVFTKFVIPTSWMKGTSHATISVPFSSPTVAEQFWQACQKDHYLLLHYLFEHHRPVVGAVGPKIRFLISTNGDGVAPIEVSITATQLPWVMDLWQNSKDPKQFLAALLAA